MKRSGLVFTGMDPRTLYKDLYERTQAGTASQTEINILTELHHSMYGERDNAIHRRYQRIFNA